jgi:hypothetical protein
MNPIREGGDLLSLFSIPSVVYCIHTYCASGDTKELASYSVLALLMPVSSKNYFSQIYCRLCLLQISMAYTQERDRLNGNICGTLTMYYATGTATNTACRISLPETRISHWMKKVLHLIILCIEWRWMQMRMNYWKMDEMKEWLKEWMEK